MLCIRVYKFELYGIIWNYMELYELYELCIDILK